MFDQTKLSSPLTPQRTLLLLKQCSNSPEHKQEWLDQVAQGRRTPLHLAEFAGPEPGHPWKPQTPLFCLIIQIVTHTHICINT